MTEVDATGIIESFAENVDVPSVEEIGVETVARGIPVRPGEMAVHVLSFRDSGAEGATVRLDDMRSMDVFALTMLPGGMCTRARLRIKGNLSATRKLASQQWLALLEGSLMIRTRSANAYSRNKADHSPLRMCCRASAVSDRVQRVGNVATVGLVQVDAVPAIDGKYSAFYPFTKGNRYIAPARECQIELDTMDEA